MSKKETTLRARRDVANEKIEKALTSAARWLKRRGARREKTETRHAYNDAATMIMNRIRR
jgi:hypothetical protein